MAISLPDGEAVVKYVPPRLINDDRTIDGAAMLPRAQDADGSSVYRLLFYAADATASLKIIRRKCRLTLAATGVFAEATCGGVRSVGLSLGRKDGIDVVDDPLPAEDNFEEDPAHALILGLPIRGVMDELAHLAPARAIVVTHPAREPDKETA